MSMRAAVAACPQRKLTKAAADDEIPIRFLERSFFDAFFDFAIREGADAQPIRLNENAISVNAASQWILIKSVRSD